MTVDCNFIGGVWVAPVEGATMPVYEPATGQPFGSIADSSAADVDLAVKAARHAFDEGAWGRPTAMERGRILSKVGQAILACAEDLSAIEAQDTGKPKGVADGDIVALARYFEFYGGAADKLHGETVPYLDGYLVTVAPEPHGVTGHI